MITTNPKPTNNQNYYNEQDGENDLSTSERYFDNLRDQFAALPMAIFEDVRSGKLKHRDVCLFAHLLVKQGTRPSSYWGIESLAELTGTYATNIKQSIARLVSTGHVARIASTSTTHTVCLTRLDPRKGSKRILIKTQALAESARKRLANRASSKRRKPAVQGIFEDDLSAMPTGYEVGWNANDEIGREMDEYSVCG